MVNYKREAAYLDSDISLRWATALLSDLLDGRLCLAVLLLWSNLRGRSFIDKTGRCLTNTLGIRLGLACSHLAGDDRVPISDYFARKKTPDKETGVVFVFLLRGLCLRRVAKLYLF